MSAKTKTVTVRLTEAELELLKKISSNISKAIRLLIKANEPRPSK